MPRWLFIALAVLLLGISPSAGQDGTRQHDFASAWARIHTLEQQERPRSALAVADSIYQEAQAAGNAEQAIKALLHHLKYIAHLEDEALARMRRALYEALETDDEVEQAILHSITGSFYWHVYRQHRHRLLERTATTERDEDDILTWDAAAVMGKAREHYLASTEPAELLQATSLEAYAELLIPAGSEENVHPTLYDVLTHRALGFLTHEEASLPFPGAELHVDERFFEPAEEFARLHLPFADEEHPQADAFGLLQTLLAFHLRGENTGSLIHADLLRLQEAYSQAALPDADSLYQRSLAELQERYVSHPHAALVAAAIALYYKERGMPHEAVAICERAAERHPDHAQECHNLVVEQRRPEFGLGVPDLVAPGAPTRAMAQYRNVDSLHVRVVEIMEQERDDWRQARSSYSVPRARSVRGDLLTRWIEREPAAPPSEMALPGEDLASHTAEFMIPAVDAGHYAVIASPSAAFATDEAPIAIGFLEATPLQYAFRNVDGRDHEVFVVDRASGVPLEDVSVMLFRQDDDGQLARHPSYETATDEQGRATIQALTTGRATLVLGHDTRYLTGRRFVWYPTGRTRSRMRTTFFTDRAVYRPGQTIHFKGITLREEQGRHTIEPGYSTTVELLDPNGQRIDEVEVTTSEYGTFSGTVTAPSGGLTGRLRLRTQSGSTTVRLEEYRRPRFEVTLDEYEGLAAHGDTVRLTGHVTSYAGVALDETEVRYQVTYRETRMRGGFMWTPLTTVESGATGTEADGTFLISFVAPEVDEASNQRRYRIEVDATDVSGATQSTTQWLEIRDQPLQLRLSAPDALNRSTPEGVRLSARNTSGAPQDVMGRVIVMELEPPDRYFHSRMRLRPDHHTLDEETFRHYFPHVPYEAEDRPEHWPVRDTVAVLPLDFDGEDTVMLSELSDRQPGMYRIAAEVEGNGGYEASSTAHVTVFDPASRELPHPLVNWFTTLSEDVVAGEDVSVLIGSSAPEVHVLVTMEHGNGLAYEEMHVLMNEQRRIDIPVLAEYGQAVEISTLFFLDGRTYENRAITPIQHPERRLEVAVSTFRDRLRPGDEERWSLTVTGPDGEGVAAEVLASMYDMSLDEIARHEWQLGTHSRFSPRLRWQAPSQLRLRSSVVRDGPDWRANLVPVPQRHVLLNLFGAPLMRRHDRLVSGTVSSVQLVAERSDRVVAGSVRDADTGDPLPGATIRTAQGNVGTTSDRDGTFSLSVPEGAERLVASFVGYNSLEFYVGNGRDVVISLGPSYQRMDDVVVAGYAARSAELRLRGANSIQEANIELDAALDVETQQEASSDPPSIEARTDLRETAFFFPDLRTDEDGSVTFLFTTPEALTRWRMMVMAHTQDLRVAFLEKEVVTQKELMVTPNAPRFFREGDALTMTARIDNLSDTLQAGAARLMLFDAETMAPIDERFGNNSAERSFSAEAGGSDVLAWQLRIPEDVTAVTYRVVADAGSFSDGEENVAPILPNRMLVTESLPLTVRGDTTQTFTFERLAENNSSTLRHHRFTLEFTPNPVWYALQALPYLAEFPHECSDQIFSRFYAHSLAAQILAAHPEIQAVYEQWQNQDADALMAALERNEDLKALVLEATPWIRQADSEAKRKQRLAYLFDTELTERGLQASLSRLEHLQRADGAWPWFAGGPANRYITQYIVEGMGFLVQVGALDLDASPRTARMLAAAVDYLDRQLIDDISAALERTGDEEAVSLRRLHAHYLYARSFFPEYRPDEALADAIALVQEQMREQWPEQDHYVQGLIALALHRAGDNETPEAIVASLREHARSSEELGMYWPRPSGFSWWQMPIEMHALLLQVFDEVAGDEAAVEAIKQWLLQQKRVQDWGTTKATTSAIHALLMRGDNLLEQETRSEIQIGPHTVNTAEVEAGTGSFMQSWNGDEVSPEMADITVQHQGSGLAWGAVHWQYVEQLDRITPAETPLSIEQEFFLRDDTEDGRQLRPLDDGVALQPGDLITVRVILRTDRDMEFVHLENMRTSGLDLINQRSGYRRQDGLWYYESPRDAATHFFFDWLPQGTYVLEYPLRVRHEGDFSAGISTVKNMYAPEFSAHSEGIRLSVQARPAPAD